MTPTNSLQRPVLRAALDEIIRTHGLWPVLRALLARLFRRQPAAWTDPPMSNHIRRDIGLGALPAHDPWRDFRR